MSILEEVKKMQEQDIPETEIINNLQQQGIAYKEISDALAQSKIKAAVEQPRTDPQAPQLPAGTLPEDPQTNQFAQQPQDPSTSQVPNDPGMPAGMQQSMMQSEPQEQAQIQDYSQDPYLGEGTGYEGEGYSNYNYTSSAISLDTITEISEQIVSERLVEIRKKLEHVINFKTTFEAKSESIEERIERIERIIDSLQSSILKKVGDYVTNVNDIKKELVETQKSFSKLAPGFKTPSSRHHGKKKAKKKK
jgi:DNA-binding transcriptional MerR regulator